MALPAGAGLVLLGGLQQGLRKAVIRLILFTAAFSGPYAQDVWLQRSFNVPQLEVAGQLAVQRKGTLEQIEQRPVQGAPDELDCLRGQLLARWSYVRIDALITSGLHEAIDQLQQDLNRLHSLIQARYFTITDLPTAPTDPACALTSITA